MNLFKFPEDAKKEVKKKILKGLKPQAFKEITTNEIDEAIDEATKGITNIDLAGFISDPSAFCDKCGECCRRCDQILLTPEDVTILGSLFSSALHYYVKVEDGKFFLRHTKPCVFLRKNKCMIYNFRPLVCRQFPLTQDENRNLTLTWYPYCKVPINMSAFKALGFIMKKIIEKTDPALSKAMEEWAESHFTALKEGRQADQIIALTKFFKEHEFYFNKKKGQA
ncbi:MAG: YkgJ family cysteine cluster protein [Candidatus Bathyarchaeia archaeon]